MPKIQQIHTEKHLLRNNKKWKRTLCFIYMYFTYFDMSVNHKSDVVETRVWHFKHMPDIFNKYVHNWADATAGGSFVALQPRVVLDQNSALQCWHKYHYMFIFLNFMFTKEWFFRYTQDFLISGKVYLSGILNFLNYWVFNAFQLCTSLVL